MVKTYSQGTDTCVLVPFPQVTSQKNSLLFGGQKNLESRAKSSHVGTWGQESGALESMNRFHCACVVPGGRCEVLFLGGFCGILSPHHKYIHWSSEATGMGLSYLVVFLCIVSFTFRIMAGVGGSREEELAILFTTASWGIFFLSSF